ncbi:hypothetical protein JW998_07145 [candidate division KSB1 bacterium]|nr:hypothetical protein [candidate division KSB1 bacterium]
MYTDIRPSGINIPLYCPPRTDVPGDRAHLVAAKGRAKLILCVIARD